MRRFILMAIIASLAVFAVTGQRATTQQPAAEKLSVLFVYEEENEKLSPWIASFREELRAANVVFDECPAKDALAVDLSKYDRILVYGAVIAFTANEPVRDWLAKEDRLSGKSVTLAVTANRWFLKKYHGQLIDLLKKKRALTVDAVSAATKNLSVAEKKELAKKTVAAASAAK